MIEETLALVGIALLVIIQIALFAYGYGKINQRVCSIDKRLNDLSHQFEQVEARVGRLEGRKP